MCSAPEKFEHSRHSASGPSDTPSGSHSDSPGGTLTPGMIIGFFDHGSRTCRSSANGVAPRFVTLTAEAAGDMASETETPSGSLLPGPLSGSGAIMESSGHQLRRSAAVRRSGAVATSSPFNPTAPRRSQTPFSPHPSG